MLARVGGMAERAPRGCLRFPAVLVKSYPLKARIHALVKVSIASGPGLRSCLLHQVQVQLVPISLIRPKPSDAISRIGLHAPLEPFLIWFTPGQKPVMSVEEVDTLDCLRVCVVPLECDQVRVIGGRTDAKRRGPKHSV